MKLKILTRPNQFYFLEKMKNLFITGKAGSGKSTLLEYFRQNTKKNHAILAPTGITAIKAKGKTVHSFFKFPHISNSLSLRHAVQLQKYAVDTQILSQ